MLAPSFCRKVCRSTISGSRAALEMVVTPLAPMAASMAFSVAPTLGMLRTISAPVRHGAVQSRLPPSSRMQAPRVRRADRCRSMGRAPMAQPPGYDSSAWPHRARMAPRNTTDERMRRMSRSGMSQRVRVEESTSRSGPFQRTAQPRCRRMSMDVSTSSRWGQRCKTQTSPLRIHAARMGSTLFFAPCTVRSPDRRRPPSIIRLICPRLS